MDDAPNRRINPNALALRFCLASSFAQLRVTARTLIIEAMRKADGRIGQAAAALGIADPKALRQMILDDATLAARVKLSPSRPRLVKR